MVPRRFLWFSDVLAMLVAFCLACALTPLIDRLFQEGGLLWSPWIEFLEIAPNAGETLPPLGELAGMFFALAPTIMLALGALGSHRPVCDQARARIVAAGFIAPFLGLGMVSMIMFGLKSVGWSRVLTFSFALLSGVCLAGYRLVLRGYEQARQKYGSNARNLLLVCRAGSLDMIVRALDEAVSGNHYRLMGYLNPDGLSEEKLCAVAGSQATAPPPHRPTAPPPHRPTDPPTHRRTDAPTHRRTDAPQCLGGVGDLGGLLVIRPVHKVVVLLPQERADWVSEVVHTCEELGTVLWVVPEALLQNESMTFQARRLPGHFPLPGVLLAPPNWDSDALAFKRDFDLVVGSLLLAALSPLMALIALVLKLTEPKSPVFYPWHVIGQNGQPFTGYKFRTMVPNADRLKAQLLDRNEMNGPVFKMAHDPRVTAVGRVLRKFSLDELPQLWSVVKGDMSLVGPRPAGPQELVRYEFWHKRKLSIKPGITCLWQVNGRNKVSDFDDWVRMDIEYIEHWSFWLDLKILARTAWVVVAGTGR